MWGSGPFERVEWTIAAMHDDLVARLPTGSGMRWLDVGCGTGAVSMRAARAGAEVTGLDLAPVLVETARRRAEEEGLSIRYDTGDCEALPYEDASFDVVSSSVGMMFAPDHAAAARELARVCRRGGRIGLTAWRPDSGVGDFIHLIGRFQPSPPEGAGNPLDWGREEYVSELLGSAFEVEFDEADAPQTGESGEELWDLFRENFGPAKTLYDSLDEEGRRDLAQTVIEFYERDRTDQGIQHERRYLLILGTRR